MRHTLCQIRTAHQGGSGHDCQCFLAAFAGKNRRRRGLLRE